MADKSGLSGTGGVVRPVSAQAGQPLPQALGGLGRAHPADAVAGRGCRR